MSALTRLARRIEAAAEGGFCRIGGRIVGASPRDCEAAGLSAFVSIGDHVEIGDAGAGGRAEALRVESGSVALRPLERTDLSVGARAWRIGPPALAPSAAWKGRVVDALGRPIDGNGPLERGAVRPVFAGPPAPLTRARIGAPAPTGVRAIDVFTPLAFGQRIGIFAGSGVGKSTLLAMLARAGGFDSVVVALVGERGREAREFLEDALGPRRRDAVAVVATADESAALRRMAPATALTIAEAFRAAGENVLLIVDSLTRAAHALREVALSAGEPPASRGYPPSVFADLAVTIERAGPGPEGEGAITGVFAILVDGDDHNDPVSDAARGALDGHVVLDRAIAAEGRFPAIDVPGSLSRLADRALTPAQAAMAREARRALARFEATRDLRAMGAFRPGADADLDRAVALAPRLHAFLNQSPAEAPSTDPFAALALVLREGAASPT